MNTHQNTKKTTTQLDPAAEALAESLQRLSKVWGEYQKQQVQSAAKAIDAVSASIQQVVDAASANHQPAPEPEPEPRNLLEDIIFEAVQDHPQNHSKGAEAAAEYVRERFAVIDPAEVDADALADMFSARVSPSIVGRPMAERVVRDILSALGIEAP